MKKAFTLAEIMIVLSIVGVLSAILVPAAFQSTPDEAVLKFKKANSTFGSVIRELVYSEKYYKGGDLGVNKSGTRVTDASYFCETFADVVAYKTKNCNVSGNGTAYNVALNASNLDTVKADFDTQCTKTPKVSIVTTDGISWYEANRATTFGAYATGTTRRFAAPDPSVTPYHNLNGFDTAYKIICFDVDDIGSGENPFGYGVRADGKILSGKRADEFIAKSVQRGH